MRPLTCRANALREGGGGGGGGGANICVLGAGVIGLSSAVRLAEELDNVQVLVTSAWSERPVLSSQRLDFWSTLRYRQAIKHLHGICSLWLHPAWHSSQHSVH